MPNELEGMPSKAMRANELPVTATSWGHAFFAILTTIAIVAAALAAPILVDPVLEQLGLASAGDSLTSAPALVNWLHVISFQCAAVILTVIMAPRSAETAYGWRRPTGRMTWLQPLILSIAVSVVTAAIAFTFFAEIIARDLAPIRQMIAAAPLWIAFGTLAVGAPLSEELLFRGYLLHRLQHTPLGFWGGALVSNTGWTLLHFDYSWLSLADVFLAGLLFSWALWRTKSIWVPIAFHALYNATVFFILLIPSSKWAAPAIL